MFGRGGKRNAERIEPRLGDSPRRRGRDDDLRADPADRPLRRAKKASRGAGGAGAARARGRRAPCSAGCVYWGFVLGVWGFVARRRPVRLLRQPAAADRPARGAQAAAQHRHPRRRRLAHRQSRRHRRRGGALERAAALSAQGLRRDRGPALLLAFRHRSRRHRAAPSCATSPGAAAWRAARR